MSNLRRRRWRIVVLVFAAAGLLALFGPKPSAERFRAQVQLGLERALQRDVQIGDLGFTLWGGPGFTLRDVVIADLPEVSAEPFAYVAEARATIALSSLWHGDLVFSRITLTQPSVNVAPNPGGGYNFEQMLREGVGAGKQAGTLLPEIEVQGARVNFRTGLQKSVYYLRNTDLRIVEEERGTNAWLVEFRAEPGRTDSFAPRFGTVRGRGRWRPDAGENGEFDMDIEIERSPLAEIASLFRAPSVGLSGYVTARAHLSGPAENMELRGRLELGEQGDNPYFFFPRETAGVALHGSVNLPANRMHVETAPGEAESSGAPAATFSAFLNVNPEGSSREWESGLQFEALPVERSIELLQYLDASFPPYPQLRGTVSGEVGFQSDTGLRGQLSADELTWMEPEGHPLRVTGASIELEGHSVRGSGQLDTGEARGDAGSGAETGQPSFEFSFDRYNGAVTAVIEGERLRPAHLDMVERIAPVVSRRPALMTGDGWTAGGSARWHRTDFRDQGSWSGSLAVRNLLFSFRGFRHPIRIEDGTLSLKGNTWRLSGARAETNDIPFRMDALQSSGRRRHELILRFDELSLDQLGAELLLEDEREDGFLRRTFSLGRSRVPRWLGDRSIAAKVYIEKVLIEDSKYQHLEGDLYWDGRVLEFRNISAKSRFGPMKAVVRADFSEITPQWHWNVHVANPVWNGGELAMEVSQSATGMPADIPDRVSGTGEVVWRRMAREGDPIPSVVRASLEWIPGLEKPRICPGCLEVRSGQNVWLGACNQSNGTGYLCPLEDPRTGQKLEINLPMSLVGH